MAALRRSSVLARLLQLVGLAPRARPANSGPGCTCESCLEAWDRHRPATKPRVRDSRRQLRPGLY